MKKFNLIATSLVAVTTLSCQRTGNSNSDTKTLDQMASGTGNTYSCAASGGANNTYVANVAMQHVYVGDTGPSYACSSIKDNDKCKAVQDVLNIIAAKNEILVRNYFDTIKGNILVANGGSNERPGVKEYCQASFSDKNSNQYLSDEARKTIEGCWSIPKRPDGKFATLMVHNEDAGSIRRNGIRIFGMFYGQAVQQMAPQGDGTFAFDLNYGPTDVPRSTLWEAKKNLASLFLKDVATAANKPGSSYSLDKLPFLTAEGRAKVKNGQAPVVDASLFGGNTVYFQRFVDTVMGEAFDSGFCQAKENTDANTASFVETMRVFNGQILPDLRTLAKSMGTPDDGQQVAQVSNGNGQSFGLDAMSFFSSLASMMTKPNMGMGTTQNTYAIQNANLMMNPTNSPVNPATNQPLPQCPTNMQSQTPCYNPSLAQMANPNLPNYNPTLLAQQKMQLQQQAMGGSGAMGSGMFGGLFGSAPTSFASNNMSNFGLIGNLMAMNGSNVNPNCPNGKCSNTTGGCSGGNCGTCSGGSCSTCNIS